MIRILALVFAVLVVVFAAMNLGLFVMTGSLWNLASGASGVLVVVAYYAGRRSRRQATRGRSR